MPCPGVDCMNILDYSESVSDMVNCTVCEIIYCIKCKQRYHIDLTCEEYRRQQSGDLAE